MTEGAPLEIDDLIVLLLGAPSAHPGLRGQLSGITRLEKLLFLLDQDEVVDVVGAERGDFESHNFGPFSSKIYQAVEVLEAADLIRDEAEFAGSAEDSWEGHSLVGVEEASPYASRRFELTERGGRYFEVLRREVPQELLERMTELKDRFGALPLRQLIRYVYKNYAEFTDKSVIRREVLGY